MVERSKKATLFLVICRQPAITQMTQFRFAKIFIVRHEKKWISLLSSLRRIKCRNHFMLMLSDRWRGRNQDTCRATDPGTVDPDPTFKKYPDSGPDPNPVVKKKNWIRIRTNILFYSPFDTKANIIDILSIKVADPDGVDPYPATKKKPDPDPTLEKHPDPQAWTRVQFYTQLNGAKLLAQRVINGLKFNKAKTFSSVL